MSLSRDDGHPWLQFSGRLGGDSRDERYQSNLNLRRIEGLFKDSHDLSI
jgi:hypothetical protein